jgi:hypothetical protein
MSPAHHPDVDCRTSLAVMRWQDVPINRPVGAANLSSLCAAVTTEICAMIDDAMLDPPVAWAVLLCHDARFTICVGQDDVSRLAKIAPGVMGAFGFRSGVVEV